MIQRHHAPPPPYITNYRPRFEKIPIQSLLNNIYDKVVISFSLRTDRLSNENDILVAENQSLFEELIHWHSRKIILAFKKIALALNKKNLSKIFF